MSKLNFSEPFLNQIKNLIWTVNSEFNLVHANKAYLEFMRQIAGVEMKLNASVFNDVFNDDYRERWKGYYEKALDGDEFEIDEKFDNPITGLTQYTRVTFNPLIDENGKTYHVVCQSHNVDEVVQRVLDSHRLMDSSLDTFCSINEDGDFVFVSAAAQDHWGYSPEELIGKSFESFIIDEDIAKTREMFASAINGSKIRTFGNRYRTKNDKVAYNFWSARWDSETKLMHCVVRDGREGIKQEELIKQSEQRFKSLVQEGSDLIAILDLDGNYIYVSPTCTSVLGMEVEEFIGRNAFDFIHPEDRETTLASLQKLATEMKVHVKPYRFQNKQNEWRWLETILTNMSDNVAVMGIVANSRDITDKIAEEQKLQLFQQVVDSTIDSIIISEAEPSDEPGPRILYVNKAFENQTGYTYEEVIGRNPRFLQGPDSDRFELSYLGERLKRWESSEITVLNYKKSGEEFWSNLMVSPIADKNGWYTHWISVQRDVTEQKNRELEQSLLSEISHIFSTEDDLITAVNKLCDSINTFGKFDIIEVWNVNMEKTELQLIGHSSEHEAFYRPEVTKGVIKKGMGLSGKVWAEKKQFLWDEKQINEQFVRKEAAAQIGIKTVLGVPLTYKGEVLGVLLVGTSRQTPYLKKYSAILKSLETFIGSEINRKRLEYDLKFLYNAIPDILCVADFEGRFLKMNAAGCEMLGYTEAEILHRNFKEFLHPDDLEVSQEEHLELTNGAVLTQFENRYITKSGTAIWLSWSSTSDASNGLVYASGKNVTERKLLRELNEQASKLSKIGVWALDLERSAIYWSEMVHELHGTEPGTFQPDFNNTSIFYREDYRAMVEKSIGNCIDTGADFEYEAIIITTDLKERWVHAMGSLELKNGKPHRVYGSLQDISDRKDSEIRLLSLANNLPGVAFQYVIYPDGTDALIHVTQGATKTWGFFAEEVMANNQLVWDQIELGGDLELVKKSIADSIKNKSTWNARWRYVMPNKQIAVHAGYGTPTFSADGRIVFHSVILDVTNESKSERLLQQASDLAKIGSWELDLVQQDGEQMYWSPLVKQMLECDEAAETKLSQFYQFCVGESRERLESAMELLHTEGREFDEQILMVTAKGNERWFRCIGSREFINNECTKIFGSIKDIHDAKSLEKRVREILESISDGFYAVDEHWKFIYFNKQAEFMLNVDAEDVIGKNFWEVFPTTKGTSLEALFRNVISTHEKESLEYYYAEDQRWYEVNAYSVNEGLSVYFKDITTRKQAEYELKKAYEEKTTILESIDDAFFAVDNNWVVTYWNKQAEKILGFKREELIGKNLWKGLNSVENSNFERQYTIAMTTRTSVSFQEYSPRYDIWFETTAYPADNGLSVYFKDITLKKKADLHLIEAKERFEKVTEATNDAIWDWDIVSNNLYRGDGFKSQFGYDAETMNPTIELRGEQIHPNDVGRVEKGFYEALEDPTIQYWSDEYRYKKADGTFAYVMDKGVIIRDQNSKPIRVVGAMKDLSDQKQTELELLKLNSVLKKYATELERSNEELEQFAFVTSHDLQEPLRMITSFMDLLKRNYGDGLDDKAHQYIHFATDGAKRMKQIILDLLLYSRANKPGQELEDIDLMELIADFKHLRKNIITEKSVEIFSEHLPIIKTHKVPITQVFHSILDNAIKYTKPNETPRIEIKATERSDEWEFSVKDNGIGIQPEFFDKIFGIFQRLHNRDEFEGTGIGLSVAKRSIEFLEGEIWLTSTPGEGSTFYFTIQKQPTNYSL